MRIAWFNIPAHGHTNPTLNVVGELVEAGHDVHYFSFEPFREQIERTGATFVACDGADVQMPDTTDGESVAQDLLLAIELIVSSTLALDDLVTRAIEDIRPDVIVSDSMATWGKLAALKHRLPYVCSNSTFAFSDFADAFFGIVR